MFKVTADNILHGVSTDSSAFSKDFFVWVFVQPLFVPHDNIAFDFGERVGGGSRLWSTAEMQDGSLTNAISAAAPKLFSSIGEPRSLARKGEQVMINSHFAEAAGRSWFAAGDNARAIGALRIAAQDWRRPRLGSGAS